MSEHYKPLPVGNPSAPPMGGFGGGPSYPDELTKPMREELTRIGVKELLSGADVEHEVKNFKGSALVLINSVCGCAAGGARPGLALALRDGANKPDKVLTAFAGVHKEAVAAVRALVPAPASSPSLIMFRDGQPLMMMHRSDIEVRDAPSVAAVLNKMFEEVAAAPNAG